MNKRILKRALGVLFVFMMFITSNIYAASITGNSDVYVGDTFTVTFDFGTNVGAYDNLGVSYDTSMFEYVSGDSLTENVWWDQTEASSGVRTKSYTFRALKSGSSRIRVVSNGVISANEAMDPLGTITAEKMINVSQRPAEETPVVPDNTQNTPGNIQPESNTSSGNNYLKYLQLSEEGLTPYFTKNITDYAISVGENVDSIEVLARAEDSNARVEISGNTNLVDGDNIITIKVTAQNGYYRIYTIIVTKSADKEKSNAYLESLIVEGYELNRDFQSEVLEYDIGEILSTVEYLNVVAATKDKDAKIEIIGSDKLVESGDGEVIIKITAPDGTTTKEYKIKYTVKAATQEEESEQEMKDYLKDIQDSKSKKEIVFSYLKYIWAAIKKNYLLVLMYLLILVEFIYIILLRRKIKKNDNNDPNNPDKTILKVDKKQDEPKLSSQDESTVKTSVNIQPPKVDLLEDTVKEEIPQKLERKGSLEKNTFKADEVNSSGIKLVDLDKNDGPKDELTFNIFENLNDDDIKKMLEEQIDDEKYDKE